MGSINVGICLRELIPGIIETEGLSGVIREMRANVADCAIRNRISMEIERDPQGALARRFALYKRVAEETLTALYAAGLGDSCCCSICTDDANAESVEGVESVESAECAESAESLGVPLLYRAPADR